MERSKGEEKHAWGNIDEIKRIGGKILVAVAGGIREENAPEAIKGGADITFSPLPSLSHSFAPI